MMNVASMHHSHMSMTYDLKRFIEVLWRGSLSDLPQKRAPLLEGITTIGPSTSPIIHLHGSFSACTSSVLDGRGRVAVQNN